MDGAASHYHFQWRRNGTDIPGANTPELHVSTVDERTVGEYVCVVSNAGGEAVSSVAHVSILPSPPRVEKEADDTVVSYGAPATLHVRGAATVDQQWVCTGPGGGGASTIAVVSVLSCANSEPLTAWFGWHVGGVFCSHCAVLLVLQPWRTRPRGTSGARMESLLRAQPPRRSRCLA